MRSRGRSEAVTEQSLNEMAEEGLRALRRATEKALLRQVVTLEDLENATRRLEAAGFHLDGDGATMTNDVAFREDPNLALASLRIELEQKLRGKIRSTGEETHGLLELVYESGLFNELQSSALVHLLTLLNSAVHGAAVTKDSSAWVAEHGAQIVAAIAR